METIACINCGTQTPALHAAYNSGRCVACNETKPLLQPQTVNKTAFYIAASLLFLNILMALYAAFLFDVYGANMVGVVIDAGLTVGLLLQNRGARLITIVRAILGLLLWSAFQLSQFNGIQSLEPLIAQIIFCATLIILLTGETKTWRLGVGYAGTALIAIYYGLIAYTIG